MLTTPVSSSKKDSETRQAELRAHFSSIVVNGVAENAGALGADSFGCQFVSEVLLGASGNTANLPHFARFRLEIIQLRGQNRLTWNCL